MEKDERSNGRHLTAARLHSTTVLTTHINTQYYHYGTISSTSIFMFIGTTLVHDHISTQ